MKKLMFATALVASAAAFADAPTAINATSFEGYSAGPVIADKGDVVESGVGASYFCFTDGDTDGSLVKTFGGDNLTAPSARAYYYASASNDKYLELNTEGGTLWRSINTIDGTANAYTLGAATNVAATGTYLDTLVQFTPTEDGNGPTDLDAADKLAIWLNVDQQTGATNLMVKAKYYFFNGQPDATETNYVLTAATGTKKVVAGEWYRLTIRAIPNVMSDDSQGVLSVFEIRVDGVQMCATTAPFDASEGGFGSMLRTMVPEALQAAYDANALFPSLAPYGNTGDTPTLQGVGFKGSGALDDIVWTEDDLFAIPAGIDFTLTWPAGLTASYQIGDGAPVSLANETVPFKVPGLAAGDVVKLFIQNADGATKMFTGTAGTDTALGATSVAFTWADYLGEAVDGAYEIDNLAELKLFQKGVANTGELTTVSTTFKLTADIALDEAWPGIGIQNAKDLISYNRTNSSKDDYITQEEADRREALFAAAAFKGTFDGQNHTVSGFQMQGGGLDYCGFFNATMGATIKNFKIAYAGSLFAADTTSSSAESGGTFVGVSAGTTNQNLTTVAGTVSCSKGFGGIVGYFARGSLVEYCTNNVNMTSLAPNKCGGIVMITQNGSEVTVRNCQNNGTTTGNAKQKGGLIGYIGVSTTIENCTDAGNSQPTFFSYNTGTVTMNGENKASAAYWPTSDTDGKSKAIDGLSFATVDNGIATFVKAADLAAGNTYKVMATNVTATFAFTVAGTIAFDTAFFTPTYAITAAEGLTLTDETVGTVKTYTAAAAGGDDYVVEIDNADVVITPQEGDLEALASAGVDTNSVAAVNTALAQTIEGTSIPAWQALFLGVAPTTNGLEQVAIKSISFNAEGKVEVVMADAVTLKTERGVDITLKLMGSTDLTNANGWTQIGSDITNTKEIPAITPAQGETKKFYKVVVEFAATPAQN